MYSTEHDDPKTEMKTTGVAKALRCSTVLYRMAQVRQEPWKTLWRRLSRKIYGRT